MDNLISASKQELKQETIKTSSFPSLSKRYTNLGKDRETILNLPINTAILTKNTDLCKRKRYLDSTILLYFQKLVERDQEQRIALNLSQIDTMIRDLDYLKKENA